MTVSEKLQMLRRRFGLTQEQFAEKIGVTRQALSKWENGESLPDTVNLISISRLFDVSIDRLLNDELELDRPQSYGLAAMLSEYRPLLMKIAGGLMIAVSSLSVIIMAVIASVNDCMWYVTKNGLGTTSAQIAYDNDAVHYYRGLIAFLYMHRLWWFFWLLAAVFLCGAALIIIPRLKKRSKK